MFATMRARKRAKSSCSIVHSIGLTRPSDMVVRPAVDPLSLPESLGSVSILFTIDLLYEIVVKWLRIDCKGDISKNEEGYTRFLINLDWYRRVL